MPMRPKRKGFIALTVVVLLLAHSVGCLAADITYTYDTLNRLQQVDYLDGTRVEYQYDEVGNLTQRIVSGLLTVARAGMGSGTVTSAPQGINCGSDCQEQYGYNTQVTLTATQDASSTFGGWSGGGCSGTGLCAITITGAVTVTGTFNPIAPVADFTASPTSGSMPLSVSFTDLSTYNPTSWLWNFGDGATSALSNPNHTYNGVGTYTVALTVTNAGGADTETKANYITATCPQPVRIARTTPVYFTTLQDAYNAALDGETIQSRAVILTGNLTANKNITVTLQGGFDCGYTSYIGKTTIKGLLRTSAGLLRTGNVVTSQ